MVSVFRKIMDLYDLEANVHHRHKLDLRIVELILIFKDFEQKIFFPLNFSVPPWSPVPLKFIICGSANPDIYGRSFYFEPPKPAVNTVSKPKTFKSTFQSRARKGRTLCLSPIPHPPAPFPLPSQLTSLPPHQPYLTDP